MGRGASCSPELRNVIIKLKNEGKSAVEIANLVGRSRKLVHNAIQYVQRHETTEKIRRQPRARKTSAADDRIITRLAKSNPFITSAEIRDRVARDHGIEVCSRTIRKRLNESDLRGCVAQHKPLVTKKNLKARLLFAKKYRNKPATFWRNVLWSDESKFNRFGSDGKCHVWRPPKQQLNPKYTVKTVKHGGGSIMVWAAFSWHGIGPIAKIDGRMDKNLYQRILQDHMVPFAEENLPLRWNFMHDNDPKHTSKLVKQWLLDQRIDVLPWPAQSPDLNPIENLWNDVEEHIKMRKPKNCSELWEAAQEGWSCIPVKRCQRLVDSLPDRLKAVIAQKGFPTKY